jgi:hypothetical protein
MADLALLQSVSYIAGALGVCVAAAYYVMNLRLSQKNQELSLKTQEHTLETRQTQLTMQLYEKMSTKEYLDNFNEILTMWSWKDYDDFKSKYGSDADQEKWMKFNTVLVDWEQIGILMKYGAFDPNMLYDQWGGYFIDFWEKIESVVVGINLGLKDKGGLMEYGEDLYYLFKEMRLRDRIEFKVREQARLDKREGLGLRSRPSYL